MTAVQAAAISGVLLPTVAGQLNQFFSSPPRPVALRD
jgi:hypothetical protein